jgi:hypothetical protein
MSKRRNDPLIGRLALAIATGSTATKWAREQGLEPRTVRNWARLPECKQAVERHRQQIVDRVIGTLARHALKSIRQIAKLAETAETDAIKLSAARTITDKLIELSTHAATMKAMSDLESRIANLEKTDATDRQTP